jgi:hypothetical protein
MEALLVYFCSGITRSAQVEFSQYAGHVSVNGASLLLAGSGTEQPFGLQLTTGLTLVALCMGTHTAAQVAKRTITCSIPNMHFKYYYVFLRLWEPVHVPPWLPGHARPAIPDQQAWMHSTHPLLEDAAAASSSTGQEHGSRPPLQPNGRSEQNFQAANVGRWRRAQSSTACIAAPKQSSRGDLF